MIIAFGGLGGSGKTTQIGILKDAFEKEKEAVFVLPLREKFLWPRLVAFLGRGKEREMSDGDAGKEEKNTPFFRSWYLFIRDMFYVFDSWRIYIFLIRPAEKKYDIVFVDRYFYDFFAELFYPSTLIVGWKRLIFSLIPKTVLYVYFDVSAKTVFERKHEFPEEIIERQHKTYEAILSNLRFPAIKINAENGVEVVARSLKHLVFKVGFYPLRTFDIRAFVLCEFLKGEAFLLKDGVFSFDEKKFLNVAGSHKILLKTLMEIERECPERFDGVSGFKSAVSAGREKSERVAQSRRWFRNIAEENGFIATEIKSEDSIEAHSDIDTLFTEKDSYDEFLRKASALGHDVVPMNATKADVVLSEGYAPIDAHYGITFGGIRFFDEKLFFEKKNVADALMIIAHAFSETTLLPLGDRMKVLGFLNEEERAEVIENAKIFHWGNHAKWWFSEAENESNFWGSFPKEIPIWREVVFKFHSYIRSPKKEIIKDVWNLARAIRARKKGIVPFHEPWFIF